jgi:hypothetical protein
LRITNDYRICLSKENTHWTDQQHRCQKVDRCLGFHEDRLTLCRCDWPYHEIPTSKPNEKQAQPAPYEQNYNSLKPFKHQIQQPILAKNQPNPVVALTENPFARPNPSFPLAQIVGRNFN